MSSFRDIPILSLAQARDPATKPQFLLELRDALLKDTGLPEDLIKKVIQQCHLFFDETVLPQDAKLDIEMKNANSFLGYNRLGNEITAGKMDWREQLDLSTPHPLPGPDDPVWFNMRAPNQWPDPEYLPEFRPIYEEYIDRMSKISIEFTSLIAEAIGLPSNAFDEFFDSDQQHKLKLVKYPEDTSGGAGGQGVGPHKDSMLSSYLLQASPHRGLQAQNTHGEWIDCPPKDGTVVVAIGQGLEAITGGVCASTTHRVLSPDAGLGPRFSIPFFQGVSYDAKFESMDVPATVRAMKQQVVQAAGGQRLDDVEFTFVKGKWRSLGEATLMNRVKSHVDVSERWYPELLKKLREQQAQDSAAAKQQQLEQPPLLEQDSSTQTSGSARSQTSAVSAH